jgi:hypothetical protein
MNHKAQEGHEGKGDDFRILIQSVLLPVRLRLLCALCGEDIRVRFRRLAQSGITLGHLGPVADRGWRATRVIA